MKESWRWFGPADKINLSEVAQTGATGVVTALHDIPYGEVWGIDAIRARQAEIGANPSLGLHWNVAESLPVHEDIKLGTGDLPRLFANYRQSLANLAKCGVKTVCYNIMPVLDWVRTDHATPVQGGGLALTFSTPRMAAFEILMLQRPGAEDDYPPEAQAAGKIWFDTASDAEKQQLLDNIMAGLPGAYDRYSIIGLRRALTRFDGMTTNDLRANFARFLAEIIPAAQELGMKMCIHPDDPPRSVFGLPRIVSDRGDIEWIFAAQDTPANGLTFCSGSFGAHPHNDLAAMARQFANRTHFLHLRNVSKLSDGSFTEDAHLTGDTDMVRLISIWLGEEQRRAGKSSGDADIPFRPDHGHALAMDVGNGAHPGYPLIGRMRGLAELRGVIAALKSDRGD